MWHVMCWVIIYRSRYWHLGDKVLQDHICICVFRWCIFITCRNEHIIWKAFPKDTPTWWQCFRNWFSNKCSPWVSCQEEWKNRSIGRSPSTMVEIIECSTNVSKHANARQLEFQFSCVIQGEPYLCIACIQRWCTWEFIKRFTGTHTCVSHYFLILNCLFSTVQVSCLWGISW